MLALILLQLMLINTQYGPGLKFTDGRVVVMQDAEEVGRAYVHYLATTRYWRGMLEYYTIKGPFQPIGSSSIRPLPSVENFRWWYDTFYIRQFTYGKIGG